jgi:hypothetical protein
MRALIAVAFCFAIVVLPASGSTVTGLRGLVTKGPVTPVCRAETACTAPAKGVLITFVRSGITRSARTGADGRYRVVLAAGTYGVRIPSARFGARPRRAVAVSGRMTVLDFSIDTGIR